VPRGSALRTIPMLIASLPQLSRVAGNTMYSYVSSAIASSALALRSAIVTDGPYGLPRGSAAYSRVAMFQ
jgi:hypothetical protein